MIRDDTTTGSPYAPHSAEETAAMLAAVGVNEEQDLFDIPESVRFDGEFGIEAQSEQAVRRELSQLLGNNDSLIEFLGRGHYEHYVPSLVDHLSDRSEFLTSYTQYQPEVTQGFLQALFEYQSIMAELTGLEVANCSMYDAATALGEAALLAARLRRQADGNRILVPELMREERLSVLENYTAGAGLVVETYGTADANADIDDLRSKLDDDVSMVYVESPTSRGTIEENLSTIADEAHDYDALFCLGTDPVALALLEEPATIGADVVVGDASVLGIGTSYGMGLGLFATRKAFLRQVPGRLVGVSEDDAGNRAYTLTLQTREQHIRRERATSNICTNQAWVALRAAIHAAMLGPSGLLDLAKQSVTLPTELADRLDALEGVIAPVDDRHHFREFVAHVDQPAQAIAGTLESNGFAVQAIDDHELQICVTDANADATDEFVEVFSEVVR